MLFNQVWRVLKEHPDICEDRMLSEIGMLFVEGFETTGEFSVAAGWVGWLERGGAAAVRFGGGFDSADPACYGLALHFGKVAYPTTPTLGSTANPLTGHTTSWTLFNIATHPESQRKIAEELDGLGLLHKPGYTPRELELDDMKKMPYMTACAKEAMRMFPVVSIMGRMATKVTKVGPYTVPNGTIVGTPLFAIQNTIHNWDAPHDFRPERWADVPVETYVYNSKGEEHGGKRGITFMPFSEGPRNCVGQSLAKMEVLTLLAKLLANFKIELAPEMGGREGVRKRESTAMTLQTTGTKGIRCHLHPRSELSSL